MCKKSSSQIETPPVDPPPSPELIFNNGFETGVSMVSTSAQFSEFRGLDNTYPKPNDFVADFVSHPNIGNFRIYYEQGDSAKRLASIVADPVNPSNKVLNFKIQAAHIDVPLNQQYTVNGIVFDKKARIQVDLYGNNGLKEIYQSMRLFIPVDFNKLVNSTYPATGDWLTLLEFWNNAHWVSSNYNFRFGINLEKGSATVGSPLYFKAEGQTHSTNGFTRLWITRNTDFKVPIGKWMTIEYYIKEGKVGDGRFYFAVTPEGEAKTVVFNVSPATCHPDDPNPDGLSEINALKLYTSGNLINQMNAMGGTMQVYWDDFKFWKNKRP